MTVVGGGSTYTTELIDGVLGRHDRHRGERLTRVAT